MVTEGNALKLLGHPTPFLAHEVNTVSTIKNANSFAKKLIRFFLIINLFFVINNVLWCKYITNCSDISIIIPTLDH